MKVSIVSVSFLAAIPHFGHFVFIQLLLSPKALILLAEISMSFGKERVIRIGLKEQIHIFTINYGIGHPQYLCLDINQSLNRY